MTDIILEPPSLSIRNTRPDLAPSARLIDEAWRWPLPRLGGRNPIVLAETDADRYSVDLGYVAAPYDGELFVPVLAAKAGEISYARETDTGFAISIVHGDWTTHYAHLSKMFVTPCLPRTRRRQFIPAGAVIGYAAKTPLHVRFELWQWTDERGFVPTDPVPHLNDWVVPSPANDRQTTPATGPGHEAA